MMYLEYILPVAFVVLLWMNLKVFFYQRTLRKVHLAKDISMNQLSYAYPESYLVIYWLSGLRWVVLIAMFFVNWIVAIICLIANFVLPLILPEQDDYSNLMRARNRILKSKCPSSTFQTLYKTFSDIIESMEKNNPDKVRKMSGKQWENKYNVGDVVRLKMEDDSGICMGIIGSIDYAQKMYHVNFEYEVSLMPKDEPEGGWVDNAWPSDHIIMSEEDIARVEKREIIGTTCHYHF